MINLIPIAGSGKRFKEKGYKLPKPLIKISGKPMVIQAISMMPQGDKWVFVCKKKHIDEHKIDEVLKKSFSNLKIISLDHGTEGQLCSCLEAEEFIDPEEPLFIGNCDQGIKWDKEKYQKLLEENDSDVICWTFTKKRLINPVSWGWLYVSDDKRFITGISIKKPVSDNPYNDYAIVGCFYFKKGKIFLETAKEIIKNNERVNNEFYVDNCMGQAIKMGYTVKNFTVDSFVSWGAPEDIDEYKSWEKFFSK